MAQWPITSKGTDVDSRVIAVRRNRPDRTGRAVGAARMFGTTGRQCVERASPTVTTAVEERRIDRADVFNAGIRRGDPVKPAAATRVFHSPHQTGPEPSTTASARHFLSSDPIPNMGGGRV